MFSDRVPRELAANRLTTAIASMRAEGRPFIDLTESNPTHAGFEYPPDLLAPLGDPRALIYAPSPLGTLDAREAVAGDYARQGVHISPDRIVLTASTSDAYSMLFKLLADAGDEVLIPRPSYPLFDHLARLDLVATRPYELDIHGGWSIDVASVERALTPRTRAVLIVSPNNPTGSFVSADDLDRLAALCAPRDVAIVADEVFADYELAPGAAARAGRAAARRDVLAFSLGGLSKSIGLPQVKLGWMALGGPDALVRAAIERLEHVCDTYLSVSTPVQVAAARLLERGAALRSQIAARVAMNDRSLIAAVTRVPSCRVLPSDGGWYAVVQVPSLEPEEDLVVRLLTVDGVLTHPGYFFDFPRESFLIVSLLPPLDAFTDGVRRMLRHFDCTLRRT
jgi:aspartate/methionine/tyrosine aminotransferase